MSTTVEVAIVTDVSVGEPPDVVVVPVARRGEEFVLPLGLPAEVVGIALPSGIDASFAQRQGFSAKAGEVLLLAQSQGTPSLLAIGVGDTDRSREESWRQLGASVVRAARGSRALLMVGLPSPLAEQRLGEALSTGALLASYRFDRKSTEPKPGLEFLDLMVVADGDLSLQATDALATGVANGVAVAGAVAVARDLVNRHPSEVTPRRLAASLLRRLERSPKVRCHLWRESRIEEENLGGLLGVTKGSSEPPRLLIAEYDPRGFDHLDTQSEQKSRPRRYTDVDEPAASDAEAPRHIVLVGKGVTFDSGGLSLKTAGGMTTMKTDMSGAAIVMAAMTVLETLGVAVRVTAIAPMSENMPGGAAMKPGDVLTARNGKTIEVLNTDAEGRLLLADGLSLAVEAQPDAIIDVATLTGAAVVALGTGVAAILGNDDELVEALIEAGDAAAEPLWRLPLVEAYESHIESDMADIKNIGAAGEAGTISAALFLQHFTGSVPWAHLDIAGTGRSDKSTGYLSKGGTAFSLRTLLGFLRAQA